MFRSLFLDGWSDRAVRWEKCEVFDAADSERSARPESPTSPCQLHSIPMPNKHHGKGGKGKQENHILPKGSACLTGETCAKNFADTYYTASGLRAESQHNRQSAS